MTSSSQTGAPKIVHDVAEAFNRQSRQSNQIWLALIAAATLALFPDVTDKGLIKLPFSLGTVDPGTYKLVGFSIVMILMIAYCRTYAEAHVATRLAHELIDRIEPKSKRAEARRFLDVLVISAFTRVAPLAQLTGMPRLGAAYYCLLKLVSVSVIFGIPSWALVAAYMQMATSSSLASWIQVLAFVATVVAGVAIVQVLHVEFGHTRRVAKLYWDGRLTSNKRRATRRN